VECFHTSDCLVPTNKQEKPAAKKPLLSSKRNASSSVKKTDEVHDDWDCNSCFHLLNPGQWDKCGQCKTKRRYASRSSSSSNQSFL
jgi:hypothetical protein